MDRESLTGIVTVVIIGTIVFVIFFSWIKNKMRSKREEREKERKEKELEEERRRFNFKETFGFSPIIDSRKRTPGEQERIDLVISSAKKELLSHCAVQSKVLKFLKTRRAKSTDDRLIGREIERRFKVSFTENTHPANAIKKQIEYLDYMVSSRKKDILFLVGLAMQFNYEASPNLK